MALKHILGEVPVIKILGFLLDHRGHDYPKVEIAEHADVGPTDMKRDFHCLIDRGIITETRRIGGVQLYKLDEENPSTKALIEFDWRLTTHWSEKIAEGDTKVVSETRDEDGSMLSAEIEMTVPNGFGNLDG